MTDDMKNAFVEYARNFSLPNYNEIPSVGLYLEQTAKYLSQIELSGEVTVTGTMISNYVKKGLITNPVKKQYSRDQIAYLMFITVAKTVLSLEDIKLIIELQKSSYNNETAYSYFVAEFKNVIEYVFGAKEQMETIGENNYGTKMILRNIIITVAYKIYLDKCISYYKGKEQES